MTSKARLNFAKLVGMILGNPTKGIDFARYTLDEEASVKWAYYEEAYAEACAVLSEIESGAPSADTLERLKSFKLPAVAEEYEIFTHTWESYLDAKQKKRQKI